MRPVVIYGANGRVGRRVAERLHQCGFGVIVAGRGRMAITVCARELGVEGRVAAVHDRRALSELLANAFAVVNCAGPIVDTGRSIASACVEEGVHYLDVTQETVAMSLLLHLHDDASRANVKIVPAAGAIGALGAWARALADEYAGTPLHEIDISYAHGRESFLRPTVGALQSFAREILHMLAPENGGYVRIPRRVEFPAPFGLGHAIQTRGPDDVALPNDVQRATVRTWLSVDPGTALNVLWTILHEPALSQVFGPSVTALWRATATIDPKELARALPPPADDAMSLVIESNGPRLSVVAPNTHEALARTVELCVRALGRPGAGIMSPASLVPARDALAALSRAGVVRVFRDDRTRRYR